MIELYLPAWLVYVACFFLMPLPLSNTASGWQMQKQGLAFNLFPIPVSAKFPTVSPVFATG